MILEITREVLVFLVVLFCMVAGFAQGFWHLSCKLNSDGNDQKFTSFFSALFNTFLFMFGQGVEPDEITKDSPVIGTIFVVVFLMLMMLLMLNLLIALMGDVFTRVRSYGNALWRREQASIILEEKFLYKKLKLPKYLLVLKYSSEVKKISIDYRSKLNEYLEASDCAPFTPLKVEEEITTEN